jgi:hypothetical protein
MYNRARSSAVIGAACGFSRSRLLRHSLVEERRTGAGLTTTCLDDVAPAEMNESREASDYVFSGGPTARSRLIPVFAQLRSLILAIVVVVQASLDPEQRCVVAAAILYAAAQLGKPYVWGGTGPVGYDCSGLVMMAYRAAGVSLPRTTFQQVYAGTAVYSFSDLMPGGSAVYPWL